MLHKVEGLVYMNYLRIKDLEDYLNGLNKIFDIVRIMNVKKRKVVHQNGGADTIIHGADCYDYWDRGQACDNCISAKAIREAKTLTKIEYNGDGVFMVMATPIIFGDDLYIVEMLKDITETMLATDLNFKNTIKTNNNITAELNERVVTDELTGAYNRRFINERLPDDLEYANIKDETISVIMLDIDNFKEINDIYGHMAGDFVLKKLVNIINSNIRKNYDWIARYGGDEFLIVLRNSSNGIVNKVIEQIQIALKSEFIKFKDDKVNITISFGIYTVEPRTKTFNEILHIVDSNLIKAKQSGKNRAISS